MTPPRHYTRGHPRDELIATVALLRADVFSPIKLSGLLDYVGSAVDLLPQQYGGAGGGTHDFLLEGISAEQLLNAESEVSGWESGDFDVRTVLDPSYPSNLQAIFDKPPLVFVSGSWDNERDGLAVAVVGTRAATQDGCKRAFRLAHGLAERGVTVISGMAKGIDTCAHRGALKAGGRTVAVMGTGITGRYPRENSTLADEILAADGALLSQFFPNHPPVRWSFPVRNVTMSGLSLATVVVEAGATSGAKMQAEAALTHGRTVLLPTSLVGAHEWARKMVSDGFRGAFAIEVGSTDEILERLEFSQVSDALSA